MAKFLTKYFDPTCRRIRTSGDQQVVEEVRHHQTDPDLEPIAELSKLSDREKDVDTLDPQMETSVTYRVVFLQDGVFEAVRYLDVELDEVEQWAYGQLRELGQDGGGQIWAAVIEAGYRTGDPYDPTAPSLFLPTRAKRRGILLDPTVLNDPLVDFNGIFALKGSIF